MLIQIYNKESTIPIITYPHIDKIDFWDNAIKLTDEDGFSIIVRPDEYNYFTAEKE